MNCKPGDLAVVVSADLPCERHLIGKIVRITVVSRTKPFVCWHYAGSRLHTPLGEVIGLADDNLRPIADPGDDVPDESTAWLPPVPLHEEVMA